MNEYISCQDGEKCKYLTFTWHWLTNTFLRRPKFRERNEFTYYLFFIILWHDSLISITDLCRTFGYNSFLNQDLHIVSEFFRLELFDWFILNCHS